MHLRVEEIAPNEDAAAGQAASLSTLMNLARGFTAPLGENTANKGLKELLKTAEVSQKRGPGGGYGHAAGYRANRIGGPAKIPPQNLHPVRCPAHRTTTSALPCRLYPTASSNEPPERPLNPIDSYRIAMAGTLRAGLME